jgi:hypothetical protein
LNRTNTFEGDVTEIRSVLHAFGMNGERLGTESDTALIALNIAGPQLVARLFDTPNGNELMTGRS